MVLALMAGTRTKARHPYAHQPAHKCRRATGGGAIQEVGLQKRMEGRERRGEGRAETPLGSKLQPHLHVDKEPKVRLPTGQRIGRREDPPWWRAGRGGGGGGGEEEENKRRGEGKGCSPPVARQHLGAG